VRSTVLSVIATVILRASTCADRFGASSIFVLISDGLGRAVGLSWI
jgi:hypothetical protein